MKTEEQYVNNAKTEAKKVLPRFKVIRNTSETAKPVGGRGFIQGLLATARTCR